MNYLHRYIKSVLQFIYMMKRYPIRIQINFILGFLVLQYLFGMFVNLFVQFPDTQKESVLWKFAQDQMPVVLHMVIGALLIIGGIVLLIRTIRKRDKQLVMASSIGLVALLIASFAGAEFVSTQADGYSYTMAVTFIIAVALYGWGLYKAKK